MVIVITGPIASGKSTVARELARDLERRNVRAVVVDLDVLEAMLTAGGRASHGGTWALARHAAAALTAALLAEGVAVVIAEGSFNTPGDRATFARHLPTIDSPLYVTLRVSFEEALRRARSDPNRGASRDPAFLRRYFAAANQALATPPATDLVIDTERVTATSAAAAIARHVWPEPS